MPRSRWSSALRPGALAGSAAVHGGVALLLVGWAVLPDRASRGAQAPIRIEPRAEVAEESEPPPEPPLEPLAAPAPPVEETLSATRPVDVEAEPLFPEEPLEPLEDPRWSAPWDEQPPDLLLAARPPAVEPATEPAVEPAEQPTEAAPAEPVAATPPAPAPEVAEAEPRGIEADESAPVEVAGSCEPPTYPQALASRGLTARVRLAITVSEDGRVEGVDVLEWSGHWPLVQRAAKAVWDWRYQAGTRDGEPVEWVVEKTILFDPQGAGSD